MLAAAGVLAPSEIPAAQMAAIAARARALPVIRDHAARRPANVRHVLAGVAASTALAALLDAGHLLAYHAPHFARLVFAGAM